MSKPEGVLYVVATPIGNLDDIGDRARRTLADVAVIAAEDTRRTGRLLTRLGVSAQLYSVHEHNERVRVVPLLKKLAAGDDVALVSDAGTPLVSDPGYRLVAAARKAGIEVRAVPGCCAAIAALSIAGLPSDRFRFEGFLPARRSARLARLAQMSSSGDTMIFFESARRLPACLEDMCMSLGGTRQATVTREMTKLHETSYSGTLADLRSRACDGRLTLRGEFTLVVAGSKEDSGSKDSDDGAWLEALLEHLPPSKAATVVARVSGRPRRQLYRQALTLAGKGEPL